MKIHQQFDLNIKIFDIGSFEDISNKINEISSLVEKLTAQLIEKGYTVVKSSAYQMGMPQSITIVKDFTGPFVAMLSTKIKDDFNSVSSALGINQLFE